MYLNNQIPVTDKEKAQLFNEYFQSVFINSDYQRRHPYDASLITQTGIIWNPLIWSPLVLEELFEHNYQQLIAGAKKQLDIILVNNTEPILNVSVDNTLRNYLNPIISHSSSN